MLLLTQQAVSQHQNTFCNIGNLVSSKSEGDNNVMQNFYLVKNVNKDLPVSSYVQGNIQNNMMKYCLQ